jgi:gliding motility-associated-like protein
MRLITGIASIFLTIVLGLNQLHAQNLDAVCVGGTETYAVSGSPGSVFIWEVDDSKAVIENRGDSATIQWNTPGVRKITVREITSYGCEGSPVYAFVPVERADIDLEEQLHLCAGEERILDAGEFDYYNWSDGGTERTHRASDAGVIWVKVSTEGGCYGSDTMEVVLHNPPKLNLGNDTALCGNQFLTLDGGYFDSYEWSTGDNSRYLDVYAGQQTISLLVTDPFGCTAEDSIFIAACTPSILFADMPNAITPNNDGVHDVWEIPNIEMYPNAKIEVFDRWGRLVFRKDGEYHNDWDGTDMKGNKLPMDSYYYVIDFKESGTEKIVGNITIIR